MVHESDRLAVAAQPVPDDLAPLDSPAGGQIWRLLRSYLLLSVDEQTELLALAHRLPQQERTQPTQMPASYKLYAQREGPGPLVMRLLCNRNLNQHAVAQSVYEVTRAGRVWSASIYARVGRGEQELTPDLLGDLSALLDLDDDEIEALTGIAPTPRPAHVGDLVWACRRLSGEQITDLIETMPPL